MSIVSHRFATNSRHQTAARCPGKTESRTTVRTRRVASSGAAINATAASDNAQAARKLPFDDVDVMGVLTAEGMPT
jgi:hypothetical protein